MKTILVLALSLFMFTQGVASAKFNSLVVKGRIHEKINIEYELSIIQEDGKVIPVLKEKAFMFYKINLEVGRKYQISFKKGDIVKNLFITADNTGYYQVDVDFNSLNSAFLWYDYEKRKYSLKLVDSDFVHKMY